jgi:integrase
MHPWPAQLSAFLGWSAGTSPLHAAWWLLAMTGMRRGELLALRWPDIDLEAGTITIRRSVGVVRNKGKGGGPVEGPTKTGKPRVIDIDRNRGAAVRLEAGAWIAGPGAGPR